VSLLTTVTVSSLHKNLHLFFYSVHKCRLFLLIHLTNSQKWSGGNFYMKFAQTENCNSHSKSFIVNISEKNSALLHIRIMTQTNRQNCHSIQCHMYVLSTTVKRHM